MTPEFKYAPIIIPTLNRYEHLKRCVESLARNTLAKETELVIGLDYPPSKKYEEGYLKIKEYLPTISGFGKVTILTTDRNLNAVGNISRLREYVEKQGYDAFIATEDDNEFSPVFLEYVNWGLTRYKDSDEVFAICGYQYLINIDDVPNNVYKCRSFSAWGYGISFRQYRQWEQWKNFDRIRSAVDEIPWYYAILPFKKEQVLEAADLISMLRKKYTLGDALVLCLLRRKENLYCLFPKVSMSRNWGADGSGLHGSSAVRYEYYRNMKLDGSSHFAAEDENRIPVLTENRRNRRFYKKVSFKYNVLMYITFICYKLGLYIDVQKVKR